MARMCLLKYTGEVIVDEQTEFIYNALIIQNTNRIQEPSREVLKPPL